MKVLILAAGYGTRLYPLIKDTPKALLEINGRPLIDFILDRIRVLKDLDGVILVTNDKFHGIFEKWAKEQALFPHPINVVNDGTKAPDDRLGSIGDIEFALNKTGVNEDVLVIGSDNLFDYNIDEYVDFAKGCAPAVSLGLYDIHDLKEATKFGVVSMGENGKIKAFNEKPKKPESTLIAMCFYYLPKASLGLVSEYLAKVKKSDTAGDYIRWLLEGNDVYGFKFDGKWYDIGSVEAYEEAKENFQ